MHSAEVLDNIGENGEENITRDAIKEKRRDAMGRLAKVIAK